MLNLFQHPLRLVSYHKEILKQVQGDEQPKLMTLPYVYIYLLYNLLILIVR